MTQPAIAFFDDSLAPAVRGFLHSPANPNGDALILTHGAGSDCTAPVLVALGDTFAANGYGVLRCALPFRQERRTGPPFPGNAERDRAGLHNAVAVVRKNVTGGFFSAGTPTVDARRRYSAPPNLSLSPDSSCFRTLCTRHANRNNSAFNICPP